MLIKEVRLPQSRLGFLVSDVSHWQGSINFSQMKAAGVQAVMIKSTESNWFLSSKFHQFMADATAVYGEKHLVLPYHYYRFNVDPVSQATHALQALSPYAARALVVDVEDVDNSAVGKADELKLFLDIIEYETGYQPIIYTGSWWWTFARWGSTVPWAKNYYLVEAEYVADPKPPAYSDLQVSLNIVKSKDPFLSTDFDPAKLLTWQFTSKLRASDYGATSTYIDMQWCKMTPSAYRAAVLTNSDITADPRGVTPPPPPPPPPPPTGNIDTLPYLRGANGIQTDNELIGQTQTKNYQWVTPDGKEWALVKGTDGKGTTEYYYEDGKYIYRLFDTSENSILGWWYAHYTNGIQGAPWLPRFVSIGATYTFSKQVSHYTWPCDIRDGLNKVGVVDTIQVVALHDSVELGTGKVVEDVLELRWLEGNETYLYARDLGLVKFEGPGQKGEYAATLEGRAPLTWESPSCITEERYYAP